MSEDVGLGGLFIFTVLGGFVVLMFLIFHVIYCFSVWVTNSAFMGGFALFWSGIHIISIVVFMIRLALVSSAGSSFTS